MDNVLGLDGGISMDTSTLHWRIVNRVMLMGRGIVLVCVPLVYELLNLKF